MAIVVGVLILAISVYAATKQNVADSDDLSVKDSNTSKTTSDEAVGGSASSDSTGKEDKTTSGKSKSDASTKKQTKSPSKTGSKASESPTGNSNSPNSPHLPSVPVSTKKNCIAVPSSCGYPDATNTGVKPGSTLTNRGSITVTEDGTVLQNLNITGMVAVYADNVVIRNSRITSGDYYPIDYSGKGLLVEDVEIIGTNTSVTAGISFNNYTARRVNIHGTVDGFKGDENVLVEDSYVHNLRYDAQTDTHNDGFQTTGGKNVVVRHSTFKLGGVPGISSIFQLGFEWGSNSNWLVENSLLDGGGWVFNAADNPSKYSGFTIRNNRFTRAHGFGPGDIPNSTWTGNFYDDNLERIN